MSTELTRLINKLRREVGTTIANLFRRGEITRVNDEGFIQFRGYAGEDEDHDEAFEDVSLWQHFGFASRPTADSEVLSVGLMGRSEEAIAIAEDSTERPTDLDAGESVIYAAASAGGGQAQVRAKPDGTVALVPGTGKFVEVGGNTATLLKAEDVISAFTTWTSAVATVLNVPAGPYVITAANTALINALNAAKATKGKVA